MREGRPRSAGFTVIEILIGSAISLVIVALACQLAADVQAASRASSARADLQQRARVAVDMISRTLREAGAGPQVGPARATLMRGVPALLPRRVGRRSPDDPEEVRTDAFTVVRAITEAEHGVLALPAPAGAAALQLLPGCSFPACGFEPGRSLMLLVPDGSFDVFSVTAVDGPALTVRHHGTAGSSGYPAGTPVIAVEASTFSHDPASRTLRLYDGDATDLPLLDDVVEVGVRYWGTTEPPRWPRPAGGESNCLYAADGSYHDALLPLLAPAGLIVSLATDRFSDGPWCGNGETRFDADLLRVRRVRVLLRLQAGEAVARGRDRGRFVNPGHGGREGLLVPDVAVEVDVSPRNLRLE